jgi:hypothetical protein
MGLAVAEQFGMKQTSVLFQSRTPARICALSPPHPPEAWTPQTLGQQLLPLHSVSLLLTGLPGLLSWRSAQWTLKR